MAAKTVAESGGESGEGSVAEADSMLAGRAARAWIVDESSMLIGSVNHHSLHSCCRPHRHALSFSLGSGASLRGGESMEDSRLTGGQRLHVSEAAFKLICEVSLSIKFWKGG